MKLIHSKKKKFVTKLNLTIWNIAAWNSECSLFEFVSYFPMYLAFWLLEKKPSQTFEWRGNCLQLFVFLCCFFRLKFICIGGQFSVSMHSIRYLVLNCDGMVLATLDLNSRTHESAINLGCEKYSYVVCDSL